MANPSLQIGSGNWAIKADELLGYRVVGNKYFPVPIDVSRATAATRVDEAGLVDYAEILGGEEVTNGDFTDGVEGVVGGNFESGLIGTVANSGTPPAIYTWVLNTISPISGTQDGKLSVTTLGSSNSYPRLKFDGSLALDKSYVLTFDYKVNSGDCHLSSINRGGGASEGVSITLSGSGTYTYYFQGTGVGDLTLNFKGLQVFEVQLDNVSIKELGEGWSVSAVGGFSFNGSGLSLNSSAIDTSGGGGGTVFSACQQVGSIFDVGKSYKLVIEDLDITSGSIELKFGLNHATVITRPILTSADNGTYVYYLVAEVDSDSFTISSATGTVATLGSISVKESTRDNVPRIDYTDGSSPHLLSEPQRENLETTSASGTYGNAPASEILAIAPDGLNTAIRPVPDSGADRYQYTITGGSYSSGYEVTYSWYRKRFSTPVEDNFVGDLKINTLVNCTQVGVTIEIASSINGYDRFSATFSITDGSLNSILRLYFGTVIGDGNSSIAYWGHQLEAGSYPTSYIPTSGSTVTRNQDVFTRDGISSLINDSEGVLFVEMAALADDGTYRTISLNKNSANDEGVRVRFNTTTNTISGLVRDGGSGTAQTTYQVSDTKDFHKVAFKYKSGESELWVDGVKRDTSADTFTLDSLNNLNFNQGTASDIFYGKVKQLQVYPTALSDSELTILTTP